MVVFSTVLPVTCFRAVEEVACTLPFAMFRYITAVMILLPGGRFHLLLNLLHPAFFKFLSIPENYVGICACCLRQNSSFN